MNHRLHVGNLSATTYMMAEKIADDIRGARPEAQENTK